MAVSHPAPRRGGETWASHVWGQQGSWTDGEDAPKLDTECPTKKGPQTTQDHRLANLLHREGPAPTGVGPTPTPSPLGLGCAPPWIVAPSWRGGLQQAETTAGSPPNPRASCPLKRSMPVLSAHPRPRNGAPIPTQGPPQGKERSTEVYTKFTRGIVEG